MTDTTQNTEVQSSHDEGITLDLEQLEAIAKCCNIYLPVVAVTGSAGSGKTTILRKIYHALRDAGYSVALCSPTGKAAKRIYEVTGIDAFTIHRLLEYSDPGEPDPKTGKPVGYSFPKRTRQNRLDYDIILADEYAMVNQEVHDSLFAAIKVGGCIRVFGDNQQLQPIEENVPWGQPAPMSPFNQLLTKFQSVVLKTVHRQGKDSGILMNLETMLKGRMPTRNGQWDMEFTDSPVDTLTNYVLESLDNGIDFSKPDNQIITQQNKSWIGTKKLNLVLQSLFHEDPSQAMMLPRHPWVADKGGGFNELPVFVGDKVMCTKNNLNLAVMNGETGTIIEITNDGEIVIDFGDREQTFPPVLFVVDKYGKHREIDPRKDIDLAYVITTHKSQGSEYRHVVYMLNKSTSYMQNRKNFYTGTSRGKEHVKIITDQQSIRQSLAKVG